MFLTKQMMKVPLLLWCMVVVIMVHSGKCSHHDFDKEHQHHHKYGRPPSTAAFDNSQQTSAVVPNERLKDDVAGVPTGKSSTDNQNSYESFEMDEKHDNVSSCTRTFHVDEKLNGPINDLSHQELFVRSEAGQRTVKAFNLTSRNDSLSNTSEIDVLSRAHSSNEQAAISAALDLKRFNLKKVSRSLHKSRNKREIISTIAAMAFKLISGILQVKSEIEMKERIDDIARNIQDIRNIVGTNSLILNSLLYLHGDIQDQLSEVQSNLQDIIQQLHGLRDELKSDIELSTWLTAYMDWEFAIYNGEDKLRSVMTAMETTTNAIAKNSLKADYVAYYETHDIEGKISNIFRMTAYDVTTTTRNLFDLYAGEKDCDITELTRLLLTINNLVISAAQQIEAYFYLKGYEQTWIHQHMTNFYTNLYGIRRQYDWQIWSCLQNTVNSAMDTTWTIVTEDTSATENMLTESLHQKLTQLYPVYDWAVVQFEEAGGIEVCNETMTSRGKQFFTAEANGKRILVFYKDHFETDQRCIDVQNLNTFIPFQYCNGCNEDNLQAADSILSGRQCTDILASDFKRQFGYCHGQNPTEVVKGNLEAENVSFIAGGVKYTDPCLRKDACGGHGQCKNIPFTKHYMCICDPFYGGADCSDFQSSDYVDNVTNFMADLRNNFANLSGIPNVVDVHFEVTQLSNQMNSMQRDIQESIKFNRLISLYSSVFTEGEFIAITYSKLLSGEISEESFVEQLSGRDFPYIFSGLESLILGKGSFVSHDMLISLKRVLIAENRAEYACSEDYVKTVSRLMKNLATLDEVITEAYLRVKLWKMDAEDKETQKETLEHIQHITEVGKTRQAQYTQHWDSTSCDQLTDDENIVEKFCKRRHSYEGMTVKLQCQNNMHATTPSSTCRRVNDTLMWDSKPSCVYVWGSWGYWSSCSYTCGTGMQRRTRVKLSGEVDTDTGNCTSRPCSDYEWGSWESWSRCSRSCDTGQQQRVRRKVIGGTDLETRHCKIRPCTDYMWSQWSSWGQCSATCDKGLQMRTRRQPAGKAEKSTKSCVRFYCSELNWSSWSSCEGDEGYGIRTRKRRVLPNGSYEISQYKCGIFWWLGY